VPQANVRGPVDFEQARLYAALLQRALPPPRTQLVASQRRALLAFPILGSDQQPVQFPDVPQANVRGPVDFEQARLYAALLQRARLTIECGPQLAALRAGLVRLLPGAALSLLTWEELQELVCGDKDINLELLKRHTEYGGGLTASSPRVINLWTVLADFTQHQRRRFVKFAYAQERLPTSDAGFHAYPRIRMLIKPSKPPKAGGSQDAMLPHADTCFFNVELPDYSSLEVMRERLTTLVEMEWGMSGDDELHYGAALDLRSLLQPVQPMPQSAPVGAPSVTPGISINSHASPSRGPMSPQAMANGLVYAGGNQPPVQGNGVDAGLGLID